MRNTIIKCLMFIFISFIIYGAFLYHSSFIVYSVFNEIKNNYETKDNIISLNETQKQRDLYHKKNNKRRTLLCKYYCNSISIGHQVVINYWFNIF